ncbi:hypothetical protein GCM10009102_08380 [Sphingomonas insulae]|uniref:Uncharacterized protein n=1 Tax=Sphingomonas insulae TaxID=424800 RepID=A0ABP3SVH2_9SPHN
MQSDGMPTSGDAGMGIRVPQAVAQAGKGDGGANGDGHERIKKTRLESRAFSELYSGTRRQACTIVHNGPSDSRFR